MPFNACLPFCAPRSHREGPRGSMPSTAVQEEGLPCPLRRCFADLFVHAFTRLAYPLSRSWTPPRMSTSKGQAYTNRGQQRYSSRVVHGRRPGSRSTSASCSLGTGDAGECPKRGGVARLLGSPTLNTISGMSDCPSRNAQSPCAVSDARPPAARAQAYSGLESE